MGTLSVEDMPRPRFVQFAGRVRFPPQHGQFPEKGTFDVAVTAGN